MEYWGTRGFFYLLVFMQRFERNFQLKSKKVKGVSFYRNCGAASVGVLQDNLILSTELIM